MPNQDENIFVLYYFENPKARPVKNDRVNSEEQVILHCLKNSYQKSEIPKEISTVRIMFVPIPYSLWSIGFEDITIHQLLHKVSYLFSFAQDQVVLNVYKLSPDDLPGNLSQNALSDTGGQCYTH